LRDSARDIKNHTLAHLDLYLEAYAAKVEAAGGHVHFCRDAPRPTAPSSTSASNSGRRPSPRASR
jgi:L-lactate dehydrogenase complex protein LldF